MKHIILLLTWVAALCGPTTIWAQPFRDPYSYLEDLGKRMAAWEGYHAVVNVTMSSNAGIPCQQDRIETWRTKDQSLTVRPNSELLICDKAFVRVDRTRRMIELHPYTKDRTSPYPKAEPAPDPLAELSGLQAEWRKAQVLENSADLIRYRYASPEAEITLTELTIDKRSGLLKSIRYVMAGGTGDECPVVLIDYAVFEVDPLLRASVFDPGRFVNKGSGGQWRPTSAYKEYTVRLPAGS